MIIEIAFHSNIINKSSLWRERNFWTEVSHIARYELIIVIQNYPQMVCNENIRKFGDLRTQKC